MEVDEVDAVCDEFLSRTCPELLHEASRRRSLAQPRRSIGKCIEGQFRLAAVRAQLVVAIDPNEQRVAILVPVLRSSLTVKRMPPKCNF